MKWIWPQILIVVCFFSVPVAGQTVHVDSDRIVYRDAVKVANASQVELFSRARKVIGDYVTQQPASIRTDSFNNEISAQGTLKLNSPYHLVKTIEYTIQLALQNGGYEYHIDSIHLKEKERGGKTKVIPSNDLLKGMDVSGPESAKMEKQLNEIDMNFQKLIDLVNEGMKKGLEN